MYRVKFKREGKEHYFTDFYDGIIAVSDDKKEALIVSDIDSFVKLSHEILEKINNGDMIGFYNVTFENLSENEEEKLTAMYEGVCLKNDKLKKELNDTLFELGNANEKLSSVREYLQVNEKLKRRIETLEENKVKTTVLQEKVDRLTEENEVLKKMVRMCL